MSTDFYRADGGCFEHEYHSNIFGHTDRHGWTRIYRAEDYIIYSPTDLTDEHGFYRADGGF